MRDTILLCLTLMVFAISYYSNKKVDEFIKSNRK